jgi:hypothetical protein
MSDNPLAGQTVQIGSAGGLVFDVTFDSSVADAPAGFTSAITDAIEYYESVFTNAITINLDVGWGEIGGQPLEGGAIGESESYLDAVSYSQLVSALTANATTADQLSAVASLPGTSPTGGDVFAVATSEAKALGLLSANDTALDGDIGFNSNLPYTFNPNDRAVPGEYDLIGVAEHEITEVMGRIAGLDQDGFYAPQDLFRYASPGVRELVAGQPAYFSPDGGVTDLNNFNSNLGGDQGDWAGSAGDDSYDAFSDSGVANLVSIADLREMNVLGYTLAPGAIPAISPDGALLQAGSGGGSLGTDAGTWTFGSATDAYGNAVLLNGAPAGSGYSTELEVANGGQVYAETQGSWWEWTGSIWTEVGNPNQLTTTPAALNVAENAAATPIGILAPSDANYLAAQLGVTVAGLPSDGTVYLSDGVTAVTVGEGLTVAQLTGLEFAPTPGLATGSASFTYTVADPAGLSTSGSATLSIGGGSGPPPGNSPAGSLLPAGSGGSLVTNAGTWTFGTLSDSYGSNILLNGAAAGGGYATELEIANGGQVYAGSSGQWWQWTGSTWTGVGNPNQLTTIPAALSVAENAAATPIGIAAPSDANYSAGQLSVTVAGLPGDGTVLLSDGVTPVTVGEGLSVAALTGLEFAPTANLASESSTFGYTVSDPAGLSATGSATLAIGGPPGNSPDGSLLQAGSGGSLGTDAGTWTFGSATDAYGSAILLNGAPAGSGYSTELEIADGGQVYAETQGSWWEWTGSTWTGVGNPNQLTTTPAALNVAENAAATPIGILAPSDANYLAAQLGVTVAGLPSDGTVYLPDGVTPVTVGEGLTVAALTGLEFAPTPGLATGSASFTYTVADPAGLSASGSATLAIGGLPGNSPDGALLQAGSGGGSLGTDAGTWTFGSATDAYGNAILLNGAPAGSGYSTELEIADGSGVYAETQGSWWEWTGSTWTGVGNPNQLTTALVALNVAENAAATPIGIAPPSDANYTAAQLGVTVAGLPNDGTVLLSDGVTPVTVGEGLSVAALTGLEFAPTANLASGSSTFGYTVSDPAGLSATGSAVLAIGSSNGTFIYDPDAQNDSSGATGGMLDFGDAHWPDATTNPATSNAAWWHPGSRPTNGANPYTDFPTGEWALGTAGHWPTPS